MLLKLQRDKLFLLHPVLQLEWLARGKFHLQCQILDHTNDYMLSLIDQPKVLIASKETIEFAFMRMGKKVHMFSVFHKLSC